MEREAKELEGTLPLPWVLPSPWRCRPSSQTGWSARPPLTLCQGKTTSHPVSEYSQPLVCVFTGFLRETDLSLGSLLSRNQSLFGHSHHPPHPSLPLSSMSHLSQVKNLPSPVVWCTQFLPPGFSPHTTSDAVAVCDNGTCSVSNVTTAAAKCLWKQAESW